MPSSAGFKSKILIKIKCQLLYSNTTWITLCQGYKKTQMISLFFKFIVDTTILLCFHLEIIQLLKLN